MTVSAKVRKTVAAKMRKRAQRARDKVRSERAATMLQKAIDTMPPELAEDCHMWISPPGLTDQRPRVNWDIGVKTNALIEAHAEAHGVTLDEVLYEIGVQFCITRPHIYWAMKSAKITVSDN